MRANARSAVLSTDRFNVSRDVVVDMLLPSKRGGGKPIAAETRTRGTQLTQNFTGAHFLVEASDDGHRQQRQHVDVVPLEVREVVNTQGERHDPDRCIVKTVRGWWGRVGWGGSELGGWVWFEVDSGEGLVAARGGHTQGQVSVSCVAPRPEQAGRSTARLL